MRECVLCETPLLAKREATNAYSPRVWAEGSARRRRCAGGATARRGMSGMRSSSDSIGPSRSSCSRPTIHAPESTAALRTPKGTISSSRQGSEMEESRPRPPDTATGAGLLHHGSGHDPRCKPAPPSGAGTRARTAAACSTSGHLLCAMFRCRIAFSASDTSSPERLPTFGDSDSGHLVIQRWSDKDLSVASCGARAAATAAPGPGLRRPVSARRVSACGSRRRAG